MIPAVTPVQNMVPLLAGQVAEVVAPDDFAGCVWPVTEVDAVLPNRDGHFALVDGDESAAWEEVGQIIAGLAPVRFAAVATVAEAVVADEAATDVDSDALPKDSPEVVTEECAWRDCRAVAVPVVPVADVATDARSDPLHEPADRAVSRQVAGPVQQGQPVAAPVGSGLALKEVVADADPVTGAGMEATASFTPDRVAAIGCGDGLGAEHRNTAGLAVLVASGRGLEAALPQFAARGGSGMAVDSGRIDEPPQRREANDGAEFAAERVSPLPRAKDGPERKDDKAANGERGVGAGMVAVPLGQRPDGLDPKPMVQLPDIGEAQGEGDVRRGGVSVAQGAVSSAAVLPADLPRADVQPADLPLGDVAEGISGERPVGSEETGRDLKGAIGALGHSADRTETRMTEGRIEQRPVLHSVAPMLVQIAQSAPEGPVTLTLSPDDLGTVRFEMQGRGEAIHVVLTAERPETLDMLRRNVDQLVSEFRQAGFSGASFSFAGGGHERGQQPPYRTGHEPVAEAELSERRQISTGLDIRL